MTGFLTLVLAISFATAAQGTLVTLDLPELTGDYNLGDNLPDPAPSQRTTEFSLPAEIESMQELRLVLTGEWSLGKIATGREVGGVTYWDTTTYYLELTAILTSDTLGDCLFYASTTPWDGPFTRSEVFLDYCPTGQADVNQLLGAEITGELFCDYEPPANVIIVEDFHGTVTDVRLEAMGAVPTRRLAWGTTKAQYH